MPTDPLSDLRRLNLRIDHITRQLSRTRGTKVRAAVLAGERDELKEERARLLRLIKEQD